MVDTSVRAARRRAITHQIERLEGRTLRLEAASNRVSWIRLGVAAAGLIAAFLAADRLGATAAWAALLAGIVLFAIAVQYHRRLEYWIRVYTLWGEMRSDELARMDLDWDRLPSPMPLGAHGRSPLALDLDLVGRRSLHQLVDVTISREGRQRLADWLTQTAPDLAESQARQDLVQELRPLTRFRDRFRLTFRLVVNEPLEGENLLEWLRLEPPSRGLPRTLSIASLLVAVNLILAALTALALVPAYFLAVTLVLYVVFYLANQNLVGEFLGALTRLNSELDKLSALLGYLEHAPELRRAHLASFCRGLCDAQTAPSGKLRKIRWATAAVGLRSNPVLGIVLNLLLPWDFLIALIAARSRAEVAHLLPAWLETVHGLDALIALGTFAYLNPEYTFPTLDANARPIFHAEAVGHPLLPFERGVRNSFEFHAPGELAIITGSNMAGKSTFVKTVGISLCLAFAGAPVNAARLDTIPFRIYTCIRITDSVVDGFSYFYAEVKCLRGLLDALHTADPRPVLYLIDEIFRGTNNRERLVGSRAYVHSIAGENGVGLLATHDLELASLVEKDARLRNFHFADQVQDGRLAFDYRIRPGPSPTTNALKIMAMEGLPVEAS